MFVIARNERVLFNEVMTSERQRRRRPEGGDEELINLPVVIDLTEGDFPSDPPGGPGAPPAGGSGSGTPPGGAGQPVAPGAHPNPVARALEAATWLVVVVASWIGALAEKSPFWLAVLATAVFCILSVVRAFPAHYIKISKQGILISKRRQP